MTKGFGSAVSWLRANGGILLSLGSVLYLTAYPLFFSSYLGDLIIDYGGELYLYWRFSEGAQLYRDLDYLYGPLPPLLSELGYRLGGRGGLIALNTVSAVATLALTQAFFQKFFSKMLAGLVLFFTVLFFATNTITIAQNYNFYTPYKAGALYGFFFSAAAFLICAWPRLESRTKAPGWHFAGGLLAAACFLSKQEHALALAVGLSVLFGARIVTEGKKPAWVRDLSAFAGGLLLLISTTLLFLTVRSGESLSTATYWILRPYLALLNGAVTGQKLYTGMSGVGSPDAFLQTLLQLVVMVAVGYFAWRAAERRELLKLPRWILLGAALTLSLLSFFVKPAHEFFYSSFSMYRALPLASVLLFFFALYRAFLKKSLSPAQGVFLAGAAFSATLCLKTFFGFRIAHYGFALGPPAFALLLTVLYFVSLQLKARKGGEAQAVFACLLLALGLAQAAVIPRLGLVMLQERVIAVKVRGSTFQTDQATALMMYHFTDELKTQMKDPADTLTVLPEANFFNWVTERKSPLRFLSLYPDQYAMNGEEAILRQMTEFPSTYIAFYPRYLKEYSDTDFASGWGQGAIRWIEAHYVKVVPSEKHREAWAKLGMELWKKR